MEIVGQSDVYSDKRRLTTIVAADICDFSAMSEVNETQAISVADEAYRAFQKITEANKGRVFKRIADGFLAEFPSARSGVQASIEFRQAILETPLKTPPFTELAVRIGVHVGDVIDREDGDILGHGVNVAVRLQEKAIRNGILASIHVINMLGSNIEYERYRRGNIALKNISESIVAFDIEAPDRKAFHQIRRWGKPFKKRALPLGLIGVLFAGLTWGAGKFVKDRNLNAKVSQVEKSIFYDRKKTSYQNEIGSTYLHQVLRDLAVSKQPSSQAVFALIETGDVDDAIALLEKQLEGLSESDPLFLTILNQIGALSFKMDPKNSVQIYETIVRADPDNVYALRNLGKAYDTVGQVCKANRQYSKALGFIERGTEEFLRLELDLAFNLYLKRDIERALDIMEKYESQMRERDRDALWSQYQTELGIILEADSNLLKSKAVLVAAADAQKELGDLANLSRSNNVLGLVALREAQNSPELSDLYYTSAQGYFEKQLQIDIELERNHSIPEAYYYLGQVFLATDEMEKAEAVFMDGLDIANREGIVNIQFLNNIGLAMTQKQSGENGLACQYVSAAQSVYDEKIDSGIGPKTRAKIADLDCGFIYKPQSAETSTDSCPN
ncbi:MAG: adenylate/guanylate cyclase domain-containing protein [Litorimonas sp.]